MSWSGIDQNGEELIDWNWLALIGNDRHWEAFQINAMILIGIDQRIIDRCKKCSNILKVASVGRG